MACVDEQERFQLGMRNIKKFINLDIIVGFVDAFVDQLGLWVSELFGPLADFPD